MKGFRSVRLMNFLREDSTQDKLDDLSKAFKTASVPAYVDLLQKYSADPKVLAVLRAGRKDGLPNDERFDVAKLNVSVKDLKPTQNEIGAAESLLVILNDQFKGLDSVLQGNPVFNTPIITYNGEYVVDGHHRWSQVYAANPDAKLQVLNISGKLPAADILKAVHTAIAVDAGQTKTSAANLKAGNLLDYTPKKTYEYVLNNLTDDAREVWKKHGFDSDDSIAKEVMRNVITMLKRSKPENWAPDRSSMPQPGESGSDHWGAKLKQGDVNLIKPKTKDAKESINKRFDSQLFEAVMKRSIKELNKALRVKK